MTEIRETMRGVVLTGHGGLEKLELRDDLPVPAPGRGEVLVKVEANDTSVLEHQVATIARRWQDLLSDTSLSLPSLLSRRLAST